MRALQRLPRSSSSARVQGLHPRVAARIPPRPPAARNNPPASRSRPYTTAPKPTPSLSPSPNANTIARNADAATYPAPAGGTSTSASSTNGAGTKSSGKAAGRGGGGGAGGGGGGASSPSPASASASASASAAEARAERVLSRLPPPLRRYAARLRGAPLTHVAAFLVLHEITAVVPLLGLFGLLHYCFDYDDGNSDRGDGNGKNYGGGGGGQDGEKKDDAPPAAAAAASSSWVTWLMEHYGGYVSEGVGRAERYFRRKGWFGFGEHGEDGRGLQEGRGEREGGSKAVVGERDGEAVAEAVERWRAGGDPRYRVVVEVALAYAVTKVLLPVRIVVSLWATPWFAGVLTRAGRLFGRGG